MKNNQQDDPNDSNKENSSTGNEENKSSDTKPSATGSKNNSNATTIIHSAIDRLLGISVEAIIEAQERNRQILATPDRFFNINTNQGNNIPGRALETPEFGMNTFREYIEDLGPGESLHFFTLERGHVVHYRLNRSENHVVQLYSPLRDRTSYTHLSESRIWPPYVKWDFFDIVPITFVRRFTREEEEQVKFEMVPFQDMEAAFHHETPKLSSSVSCTDLTHEALEKLDERMSVPPVMKSLPLVDPPTLPFKSKVIAPSPHLRNIFVYQNFGRIRSNSWSASDSDSVQPESSSSARRNPDHLPPAHMRMVEWPPAEEGVVPRIVTVTLNRAYMSVSRRVQGTVSPSPGVGEVPRDLLFPVQEEQEGEVRVERNEEEAGETIENSPQAMEEENVEAQPQEEQMAVSMEPEAGPSVPLVEPEPVKSPRKRSHPDSKPTSAAGASSTQALQPRIPGSLASPPEVNLYGKPSTSSSQQSLPPAPAVEQPEAEEEEPSRRVSAPARMVNNSVAIRIDARPRPGPNPAIGLLNYVNPLSLGPAQGYPASLGVTNNIGNMSTFDTLFNRSVGALCLAVREDEPEASTSADEARIPLAEMNLNAPEGPSVSPPSRPESGNISDISTPEVVTMANAFLLNNPLPPLISPLSSNTTNSGSTFSLSSSRRSSNDESSSNEAYVIRYANGERVRRTGAYVPTPPALNQTEAEGLPATRTSSRVQSDEYRILTNAEAFNGANYLLLLSLQQLSTVRSVYDLNGIIFALVCAQDFLFYHCTDASEDVMLTLEFLRTLQINQSEDLLAEVRRKVNDLLAPHTWRRQLMQFQHQRCIRDRGYDADGLALQELPELPILPEEFPAARDEEGSEREALQVSPVASGSQDDDDDPSPSKRARKTEASDGDNIDED